MKDPWWRRWLVEPLRQQLMAGASPEKLSWAVALGIVLGIFPIMGSTTLVCLLVGWLWKLNQPVLHAFNTVMYPLHLALILVFIRLGQQMHGVPLISFSITEMLARFEASPRLFVQDFGLAAWHGITAWLLLALVLAPAISYGARPAIRRLASMVSSEREVAG
jgi:uncharacterized protein (DUF2062 family)